MPAPDPALVSVIIRSIGRASLASSVASVIAQAHRPIEIVVVNASTNALPELPRDPSLELRVHHAGPSSRPRAANAGLDAARGDWLVFLDDDDVFLPGHVDSLLPPCGDNPDALVAYSATTCVDDSGAQVQVLAKPFDRLTLFEGNYIQIGAALFSRRLVAEGCRFDEQFECLQDWDFWIQLAQRTRFVYTGEATNQWSAFTGGSGCGMGVNSDESRYVPFSRRLRQKWAEAAGDLRGKVRHHQSLAKVATQRGHLDEAQRHLAAADALLQGAPGKVRSKLAKRRMARVTA
jgi:Glycosyltransferases involved in cell wall biogenesis